MSEEKLKGLKDEAVGKVKETEGKLTDDKVRKTQGKAQYLVKLHLMMNRSDRPKARKKAADLKEDIEQGAEKLKEKFEKDDGNK